MTAVKEALASHGLRSQVLALDLMEIAWCVECLEIVKSEGDAREEFQRKFPLCHSKRGILAVRLRKQALAEARGEAAVAQRGAR